MQPEVLYANISGENEPYVMDSLCPNCEKSGKTTLMLTKIPFFKDIIIVSFQCEECGERNNEVQFGGKLAEHGKIHSLTMENQKDLNRECIKSEHGVFRIPSLEFEIPSNKKGVVNTIEGFLSNTIRDLEQLQPLRRIQIPESAQKIDEFIEKLQKILDGSSFPIVIELQDPSGNSYIQNPFAPNDDPQLKIKEYKRTIEEIEAMGYSLDNEKQETNAEEQKEEAPQKEEQKQQGQDEHISAHKHDFSRSMNSNAKDVKEESHHFTGPCHVCFNEGDHNMCTISIPYFKDIVVMSFLCPHCGVKDTEIKSGGEITPHGKIIKLNVQSVEDLKRDLFKSETAGLEIPELELELSSGTLGGVYTTVEGILEKILVHLQDNNPFAGDSDVEFKERMNKLFTGLRRFMTGEEKFTMIIKDVVDNSFLQNPRFPDPDPNVEVSIYERTEEDNENLGIDKMKVDNY